LCEQKESCLIDTNYLGDPCQYGILNDQKQLTVQYQCVDSTFFTTYLQTCPPDTSMKYNCPLIPDDPTVVTLKSCNNLSLRLRCLNGDVIEIVCAFYGADPIENSECNLYNGPEVATSCYGKNSVEVFKTKCDGKTSCTVISEGSDYNSFLIDSEEPCTSSSKLTLVQYKCVDPSASSQTTTPSPPVTLDPNECTQYIQPNGTCPTSSPHLPMFLNGSLQVSYEYPLLQTIVCDESTVVLVCPANQVIHIYAGYYGIQSQTETQCKQTTTERPFMCSRISSLTMIHSMCEREQTCSIEVNGNSFNGGNPADVLCSNYERQLLLQYQCVDDYTLESGSGVIKSCLPSIPTTIDLAICESIEKNYNIQQNIVCDGDDLMIKCPQGRKISILCSFYGINPSFSEYTCDPFINTQSDIICYFKNPSYLISNCINNECLISGQPDFTNVFGEPCLSGVKKMLFLQWKCVLA
jgi:hypothetical protein